MKKDDFIEQLRDKHHGEKIFIVATGPSLKPEYLEKLKEAQAVTISMNGIFKIFNETQWRPDYYVMDDYWLIEKYVKNYPEIKLDEIAKQGTIFAEKIRNKIPYAKEMKKIGYISVCYFDHWYTHYSRYYAYNRDIASGNFDFYTVTNFAINLADYMGATEIYLLGVDCDYTSGITHIGENSNDMSNEEKQNCIDMEAGMLAGYRKIHSFIGDRIRIINVNKGGKVEVFPRMEFSDICF